MLEAHYNGWLNIEDYWNVGDTRIVPLDTVSYYTTYESGSGNNSHEYMYYWFGGGISGKNGIELTIIGINHDKLKNAIGNRTLAAITVQTKGVYGDNTYQDNFKYSTNYSDGYQISNGGMYIAYKRSGWFNTFLDALPNYIKNSIKYVTKCNLDGILKSNNIDIGLGIGIVRYSTRGFFLSYKEIVGSSGATEVDGADVSNEINLSDDVCHQYEYMVDANNRIKYEGMNDYDVTLSWWTRTTSTTRCGICINDSGTASYGLSINRLSYGLSDYDDPGDVKLKAYASPAFCL